MSTKRNSTVVRKASGRGSRQTLEPELELNDPPSSLPVLVGDREETYFQDDFSVKEEIGDNYEFRRDEFEDDYYDEEYGDRDFDREYGRDSEGDEECNEEEEDDEVFEEDAVGLDNGEENVAGVKDKSGDFCNAATHEETTDFDEALSEVSKYATGKAQGNSRVVCKSESQPSQKSERTKKLAPAKSTSHLLYLSNQLIGPTDKLPRKMSAYNRWQYNVNNSFLAANIMRIHEKDGPYSIRNTQPRHYNISSSSVNRKREQVKIAKENKAVEARLSKIMTRTQEVQGKNSTVSKTSQASKQQLSNGDGRGSMSKNNLGLTKTTNKKSKKRGSKKQDIEDEAYRPRPMYGNDVRCVDDIRTDYS